MAVVMKTVKREKMVLSMAMKKKKKNGSWTENVARVEHTKWEGKKELKDSGNSC